MYLAMNAIEEFRKVAPTLGRSDQEIEYWIALAEIAPPIPLMPVDKYQTAVVLYAAHLMSDQQNNGRTVLTEREGDLSVTYQATDGNPLHTTLYGRLLQKLIDQYSLGGYITVSQYAY